MSKPIELSRNQQQFVNQMRRALVERRQVVEIDNLKFRFARRGETFDDGDFAIEALESGVFVKLPTTRGRVPADGTWVCHGSTDELEDLLFKHFLVGKSDKEIDSISLSISANAFLTELHQERSERRTDCARRARP